MMGPPEPGPEIWRRASSGDQEALREVLSAHLADVLRWCMRHGRDDIDPDDAAQDVIEIALRGIWKLRDPTKLRSWLYGITRRKMAELRRKPWRTRRVHGPMDEPADGGPDPHERLQQKEKLREAQRILEQLPDQERDAFVACDLEGFTYSEASDALEIPEKTVASRLRRARRKLRRLAPDQGEPPRLDGGAS